MREERGREVCAGVVEGMEWFGWAIFCTFGGFFLYIVVVVSLGQVV